MKKIKNVFAFIVGFIVIFQCFRATARLKVDVSEVNEDFFGQYNFIGGEAGNYAYRCPDIINVLLDEEGSNIVFRFEKQRGYARDPKTFSHINEGRQERRREYLSGKKGPKINENTTLKEKDGCVVLKYAFKEKEDWHWLSFTEETKVSFNAESGVLRYDHEDRRTSGKNLRWKFAEFIADRWILPGMGVADDTNYDQDCFYVKAGMNMEVNDNDDELKACNINPVPQNNHNDYGGG